MNTDPSIIHTNDDPRKGGKLGCLNKKEAKAHTPNVCSQCRAARNDRNNESQSFGGGVVASSFDMEVSPNYKIGVEHKHA